jgi:hypothetical protein
MGAHASYPLVIYHLVSLKSHFHLITIEKFQGVIKELSNYEIYPNSDNDHLPDHTQLADKLKCNQLKMNKILKDLHDNIIKGFNDHPLIIKDLVHILHVSPYIDQEDKKNKEWVHKEWERAISIPVVLPVTPKIGEYVEIPFMKTSYSFSSDDKYSYGYVHDVRHTIRGTTQEISIFIYPHKNVYYKWEEMKKEYEEHKRWLAWLKTEKDRS